jgi:hypothetical protein
VTFLQVRWRCVMFLSDTEKKDKSERGSQSGSHRCDNDQLGRNRYRSRWGGDIRRRARSLGALKGFHTWSSLPPSVAITGDKQVVSPLPLF